MFFSLIIIKNNLIGSYKKERTRICGVQIDSLVDFCIDKLNEHPLYLLNKEIKIVV